MPLCVPFWLKFNLATSFQRLHMGSRASCCRRAAAASSDAAAPEEDSAGLGSLSQAISSSRPRAAPCAPRLVPDPAGGPRCFLRRVPWSPSFSGVQVPAVGDSPSQTGLVWRRFFLTPDE